MHLSIPSRVVYVPPSRTIAEACLHAHPQGADCNVAQLSSLSLMGRVCVCCATPSSLNQARQIGWSSCLRERWGVWDYGRRERGLRDFVPIIFAAWQESLFHFECPNLSMNANIHCSTTQRTSSCWPRSSLAAHVNKVSQATCQHTAGHSNLLSVTRRRLINENLSDWTHY